MFYKCYFSSIKIFASYNVFALNFTSEYIRKCDQEAVKIMFLNSKAYGLAQRLELDIKYIKILDEGLAVSGNIQGKSTKGQRNQEHNFRNINIESTESRASKGDQHELSKKEEPGRSLAKK